MLLHEGGSINLLHSTFQANFGISEFPADVMNVSFVNGTDSVGIVNLGGEVHCDILGCLPVCTSCLSLPPPPTTTDSCCEARQVSPPTSQPIVAIQPAVAETGSKHRLEKNNVITGLEIGSSIALLIFGVAMAVLRRRRARCCFWLKAGEDRTSSNQQPFFDPGDGDGESVELVGRSMMKTHETSPGARAGFFCNNATFRTVTTITIPRSPPPPPSAPVFVVGRNSMRITLWSPGMEIAVPTHGSPVGGLLSDLPFVNGDDGYRLHRSLGQIFDAPTEHDPARTFVLHFLAQNRRVLLEMVATHVFVTDSESAIVLTGRLVDAELAGLMACDSVSTVALSESNYDVGETGKARLFREIRSVSRAGGSIKGGDDEVVLTANHDAHAAATNALDGDSVSSTMSSLTMSNMKTPPTSISALTLPSALRPPATSVDRASKVSSLAITATGDGESPAAQGGEDAPFAAVEEALRAAEDAVYAAVPPPRRAGLLDDEPISEATTDRRCYLR